MWFMQIWLCRGGGHIRHHHCNLGSLVWEESPPAHNVQGQQLQGHLQIRRLLRSKTGFQSVLQSSGECLLLLLYSLSLSVCSRHLPCVCVWCILFTAVNNHLVNNLLSRSLSFSHFCLSHFSCSLSLSCSLFSVVFISLFLSSMHFKVLYWCDKLSYVCTDRSLCY